jgi:PAS domain S-box-containing protein
MPEKSPYKLQDLIDIEQFQGLQDRLNEIYSFPSAIIDNEGNILTATAWQEICTQFHRQNKECEKECIKSDQYILAHLADANPAVSYRCPHGLVDNATPIVIDGIHYGNFFTGQFFLEEPDLEFFRSQAGRYGFDEQAYLAAVKKVPIWSQRQLENYLYFIKGLIEVISSSAHKKLQEIEAHKQIEESEERAIAILNQMSDAFWVTSRQGGKILDVNPAMCQLLGYTRAELLERCVADVEAIDTPQDIQQRIQHLLQAGSTHFESRFRRKDGSPVDVEVSVTYLPAADIFFGFHREITERKQAEKVLQERDERFQSISAASPDPLVVTRMSDGRIFYANEQCAMLFAIPHSELMEQRSLEMYVNPSNRQALLDMLQNGVVYDWETQLQRADGAPFWAVISARLGMFNGEAAIYAGIRDNTERKQWQAALENERSALEQRVAERTAELSITNASLVRALQVKDEFLASMSHELRTPLTGILGLSEVLRAGIYGKQSDQAQTALRNIEESGQHLLSLINDILDLSKAEAGKIDLDLRSISVTNLVESSIRLVRQTAQKKNLRINTNLDSTVEYLEADERRMKQILVNLLSNAVKFTNEGGMIGLDVSGLPDKGQLDFTVWDTGIGIQVGDMDRLFKPFVQLDTRLDRPHGGTGLGLSLVHKLVELHGGSIRVESEPGRGSRFTVSLPWRQSGEFSWKEPGQARVQGGQDLSAARDWKKEGVHGEARLPCCLVAEDNEVTLTLLRDSLSALGYKVLEARNGAEALQRAHEAYPDIIVMDVQMPVLNGLAAIQILRQDPRFKRVPVIAVTALAMAGDRERILEAGADDYLSKPVDLDVLDRTLVRLLS